METWISTALGIAVSILLFLLSYRQTVGARKERARAAVVAVENATLKRVVQEQWTPRVSELQFLLDGAASEHRVKLTDLALGPEILRRLYTRVAGTDLLAAAERAAILQRLSAGISAFDEHEDAQEGRAARGDRKTSVVTALLGVAASTIGVIAATYQALLSKSVTQFTPRDATAIFFVSLVTVGFVALVLRLRDRLADPERETEPDDTAHRVAAFEREVLHVLRRYSVELKPAQPELPYDFEIVRKGTRILIDVRSWQGDVPLAVQRNAAQKMHELLTLAEAGEAWIVIPDAARLAGPYAIADPNVKFLSLNDLKREAATIAA